MQKPNNYNLISDFASFASDSSGNTISLSIPSGTIVPTSNPRWDALASGGSTQSFIRARMMFTRDGKWGTGTTLLSIINVSILDGSTVITTMPTGLYARIDKISATDVRLRVFLEAFDGYSYRLNEQVTIQAVYSSFLNPML